MAVPGLYITVIIVVVILLIMTNLLYFQIMEFGRSPATPSQKRYGLAVGPKTPQTRQRNKSGSTINSPSGMTRLNTSSTATPRREKSCLVSPLSTSSLAEERRNSLEMSPRKSQTHLVDRKQRPGPGKGRDKPSVSGSGPFFTGRRRSDGAGDCRVWILNKRL